MMPHDVFISHSSKDKPTADAICASLEAAGVRCWVAPRDILPGANWGEAIINAIAECRLLVIVFSSNANNSSQVMREIERAAHKGIPIIPVRIEDVLPTKSLEYFLSTPHWLDALTPPLQSHIAKLTRTVQAILGTLGAHDEKILRQLPTSPKAEINTLLQEAPPDEWFQRKPRGILGKLWKFLTQE